jgi:peptidoglycan hydrolase-like protein with peptidoglycan-binding domain
MEPPKLDMGTHGKQVRSWQLFLVSQEIGLDDWSRMGDGIFGAGTRRGTEEYQSRNGLAVTGFVDAETYAQAVQQGFTPSNE